MAASTGPVLAMGAITLANKSLFHGEPIDWRIPVATGLTAGCLALMEKAAPGLATGLAWIGLVTVLLTRLDPNVPSPVETALDWFNKG